MQGFIKRYVVERGFGFIQPDETTSYRDEVFVHIRAVKSGELAQGARVEYEMGHDVNGRPRAEHVYVLEEQ